MIRRAISRAGPASMAQPAILRSQAPATGMKPRTIACGRSIAPSASATGTAAAAAHAFQLQSRIGPVRIACSVTISKMTAATMTNGEPHTSETIERATNAPNGTSAKLAHG